jgi:hypothetical protein
MNIALMLKWIWKLYQDAEGLWADIIRAKYLRGRDLFDDNVPTRGSQFWNSIQKIKWYFKLGAKHGARNGRRTRFWLDWWTGRGPFMARFPLLFSCCTDPLISVADAAPQEGFPGEWKVEFRRPFGTAEAVEWDNLCREAMGWLPGVEEDTVSWSIDASGTFTAKSVYLALTQGASVTCFKEAWRTRVPPKIRVFLWQLIRGRLPSCDQVAKRHRPSDGRCALCQEVEDCNHIFFSCPIARMMWAGVRELLHCDWNPAGPGEFIAIAQGLYGPLRRLVWFTFAAQCWTLWTIRNKLTIEGKMIGNPADVFYQMLIHMQCWRVLVRQRDRAMLDAAVDDVRRLYARLRAE